MPTVSWSEVKLFRRCPKAHDYKYNQLLKRKRRAVPLIRGAILHEMLEAFCKAKMVKDYPGKDPWQVLEEYEKKYADLFREEREHYGDIPGDCGRIFEAYLRRYRKEELKYEASETFAATDIAPNIRLICFIDKVAIDKQGRRFIMDHKFVRTIPTADERFFEIQTLIYLWVWNRWAPDRPVDGVIWDYARAKAPVIPEVLKNGQLSQRMNIDTDVYTYREAIKEQKLDVKDYTEILAHLEGKDRTFFERSTFSPPKAQIESVIEDFRITAIMIKELKGVAPRYMSHFNCNTCEFKPLCEAELRGHDADFIRKSQYEPRKEHDEDGIDEEA